jgi:hypothetical protein
MIKALILSFIMAVAPVAADVQTTKADQINQLANVYDHAQYALESCLSGRDVDHHVDFTMNVPPEEQDEAIDSYQQAGLYLAHVMSECQADRDNGTNDMPQTCWGFWPPDSAGGLHWMLMPCDEKKTGIREDLIGFII